MQYFSADALVLRAVDRGDNDKLLTVLTPDLGRFYVIAKGAHSMRRREGAALEPFTWSNMEFYERNGVKWVKNATSLETFTGVRYDMDKLFLASYICEVAAELSDEREPAGEILPLTLNTLHILSRTGGEEVARIKGAFEMRAACIAGFAPELSTCRLCHQPVLGDSCLDVMNGAPICAACRAKADNTLIPLPEVDDTGVRTVLVPLSAGSLAALRYVAAAPARRVFAFRLTAGQETDMFGRAAETYLLHHLERGFVTLENYKKLKAIGTRRRPTPPDEVL